MGFLALSKLENFVGECASLSFANVWGRNLAQISELFSHLLPSGKSSHSLSPSSSTAFPQRVTVQRDWRGGERRCSDLPKEFGVRWLYVHMHVVGSCSHAKNMTR